MKINKERLVHRFCALTAIDSESFHERAMADYLIGELRRLGFHVSEDDAGEKIGGDAGNLYAFLPPANREAAGSDSEKNTKIAKTAETAEPSTGILLTAHMDTVKPGIGKKAVVCEDGTIRSDGTTVLGADDAAAIAAILEAVEETIEERNEEQKNYEKDVTEGTKAESGKKAGAILPLEILFTVAEEAYGLGAAAFDSSKIRAKTIYGLDLSAGPGGYSVSEPSLIAFTADIQGRAAHAGFEPEKGISAINAAAEAVLAVPQGWIEEGVCCNIGIVSGGKATNIVPEHVTLQGEIRSRSHSRALSLIREIEEKMKAACERRNAVLSFRYDVRLTAYEVPENDPAVLAYKSALDKLTPPVELRPVPTFGGSDINEFRRKGLGGIILALPMYRAHSTEEYTVIDELVLTTELLRQLIISA